ncbi:hypothetical protein E9934_15020 [Nocardioides caeni]|uniref:Protein kinase domain-containing protein n=1 Tax=Nocardioides caeni TaxID=574700 RepID=A0A4S8N5F2_9ACTN|nr:protein kinase family protein [Nocardioides caeni]THV10119.1 hypothetical protein E9934_15020 [Nocardioides caeni]
MGTSTRSGDVLAGRYRLIDLLSESGGGRFWRAHDNVLERFVALHVIGEDDPRAPGLVEAARTSAGVLDARILRVLDAEREDGRCFVVNEWGTGISLDILVTHQGPLSPRRAAWLVADVAGAIARAHHAGVSHGRLNPENVLIDRHGSLRVIGLCVDAALHGLPPGSEQADLEDLGGLLYCALTGVWPGPSGSIVPAAPREHGAFLSPRQVRAGVPKSLDLLWRELDRPAASGHRRRLGAGPDVSSAGRIAAELLAFVGDPSGMQESLASAIPPINELRPVWLPALNDPLPHDSSHDDIPMVDAPLLEPVIVPAPVEDEPGSDDPPIPTVSSVSSVSSVSPRSTPPTEEGIPVFGVGESGDDVQWLRPRSTPPPPPPPFEDLPERPLFAPEGHRRPPPELPPPDLRASGTGFWPWDTETGDGPSDTAPTPDEAEPVPGRSWLRLAMVVGVALLLLVAVAIAFNLGRGRDPLGGSDHDGDDANPTSSTTPVAQPRVLAGVTPGAFDPLSDDGVENDDALANVVDGDPETTWSTSTYTAQLGPEPPALKPAVGLVLDLGEVRTVTSVEVATADGTSTVGLFASTEEPTAAPTGDPLATATGGGDLRLAPSGDAGVRARYLVLWWTVLPTVDDGFRADVSEVVVRGE